MISIIIPAHNEEKVIVATLGELIAGATSGELEVIVVCNGCTDKTVEIVTSFGPAIKCIETDVPSKTNALNLGDMEVSGFPRFYQDADVILSLDAIRQVAQVLRSGHFLAASPQMRMELREASWPVRAYYEVWQQLSYVEEGMIGAGVYALSKEGREKFVKFPQIIADDGYIRTLFQTNERTSVDSCHSLVRAPSTLSGLLKIKTRSRLGWYELKRKFPELMQTEKKHYGNALLGLLSKVHLWSKIPVYLFVNLLTRFRAKKYAQLQGFTGWERDDSSRSIR
ncbi:MAG: glycosyltransferase [Desulfobulbus sp.]|jgi:glycosyltransferase involved in cell wall biosynthesis|nr:glycosyltransferase [Desulfobulbus sp.]